MDDSEFDNSGDGDGDGDGPFQWVRPLPLHKNTTIKLGSARLGLNRQSVPSGLAGLTAS